MSYYVLGTALWDSGDLEGAVRNYRSALQISPNLTEASARLGFILVQQNKPAEAEVEFREVLRVAPSDTKAHKYLGDALAAQGKLAEAEAEYSTVLKLNPGNAVIYDTLKHDLEKLATAKALTNLYETLKVQPTPEAHVQIAAIRVTQGEFQDAVGHYLAALRLKPDAPDILNNLAWLLATCPDDRIRDGAQAVEYASRACELTQNRQTMTLGTLAAAYAEAGRFDEAVATAQKACDLATQQGETGLLQKNQALLELYRAHKPWRE
jgi:cytochrome c-type biogenesis protein CcmH/NrfG